MNTIIKSQYDSREYATIKLKNGIDTLLVSDPTTKLSHCAVTVNAGSMMDGDVPGLAHFLEHMLFMGTEKYSDVGEYMNYISSHGGNSNAFTSSVYTCYFFSINSKYLSHCIDRLTQFFISPLFKKETVMKEINAIDSEFNEILNNFSYVGIQMLKLILKKNHPFCQFDVGSKTTLMIPNIREKLIAFFKKYYVPINMKLIIFDSRPLKEMIVIAKIFEQINNPHESQKDPIKNLLPIFENPIVPNQHIKFMRSNSEFNSNDVGLYWAIPNINNLEYNSMFRYILYLFGRETSSSLITILRRHSLINSMEIHTVYNLKEFQLIGITLNMTVAGINNFDLLVGIILKYINDVLISHSNPESSEYYHAIDYIKKYNECQRIKHEFSEKIELTSQLAELLHNFCEKAVDLPVALKYDTLPCYFNINLCKYLSNYFSANNMCVVSSSNLYKHLLMDAPTLYSLPYTIVNEKFSYANVQNITRGIFTFNDDFIPTKLLVYTDKASFEQPHKIDYDLYGSSKNQLVSQSKRCSYSLWYSYKKMLLPKACVVIKIVYPMIYSSIKTYVSANILLCHINRLMVENLYDACLLDTTYDISINRDMIQINVYGFNEKLSLYCTTIISKLMHTICCKDITSVVNTSEYALAKNMYLIDIEYSKQRRMSEQLHSLICEGVFEKYYSLDDIINSLEKHTYADLLSMSKLYPTHITCMVNGNIPKSVAIEVFDNMKLVVSQEQTSDSLQSIDNWKLSNSIEMKPHEKIISPSILSNNHNLCSVVVCLKKCEKESNEYEKYFALNLLFDSFMHSTFFATLRSQQQLGYTVKCIPREFGIYDVLIAMTFSIVSQQYSCEYIQQQIFKYFSDTYESVKTLKEEQLREYIESCINLMNEKPDNIRDETYNLFIHIAHDTCNYNFRNNVIDSLNKISLQEFKEIYNNIFILHKSSITIIKNK